MVFGLVNRFIDHLQVVTTNNCNTELLGFWTFSIVSILEYRKHNVLETGSVSIPGEGGKTPTQLGPLERANLSH
jgi:hypothetical protein